MIEGMARAGARVRAAGLARLGAPRAGFRARARCGGDGKRPAARHLQGRARPSRTPISTTTPSCSAPCSSCCRRISAATTWTSPRTWPMPCSIASRIATAAASSSPATITSALIHRPKPGHDNATPSGNGVARSGAAAPRPSHWRDALSRGRRARPAVVLPPDAASGGWILDHGDGAGGAPGADANGDPARARPGRPAVAASPAGTPRSRFHRVGHRRQCGAIAADAGQKTRRSGSTPGCAPALLACRRSQTWRNSSRCSQPRFELRLRFPETLSEDTN